MAFGYLFWPSCVADADILFYPCGLYLLFFLSSFSFPCLFSTAADWMSTILPRMMALLQIYTISKKVPTFKLSVTLSNLNRISKFWHCWKAYEICYKTICPKLANRSQPLVGRRSYCGDVGEIMLFNKFLYHGRSYHRARGARTPPPVSGLDFFWNGAANVKFTNLIA